MFCCSHLYSQCLRLLHFKILEHSGAGNLLQTWCASVKWEQSSYGFFNPAASCCSTGVLMWLVDWWFDETFSTQAHATGSRPTLKGRNELCVRVLYGIPLSSQGGNGVRVSLCCSFEICTVPQGRNHQLTTGNVWCSCRRQSKQEVDGRVRGWRSVLLWP